MMSELYGKHAFCRDNISFEPLLFDQETGGSTHVMYAARNGAYIEFVRTYVPEDLQPYERRPLYGHPRHATSVSRDF